MFFVKHPSPGQIDRFLRDSRDLPLSYGPAGIVRPDSGRNDLDEVTVVIGHGQDAFERARAALTAWRQFDVGWIETFPRHAPIEVGTNLAVLIRHVGLWSLNGCRVLYSGVAPTDVFRFGVAYGTLTNHAESGEELFEVFIDAQTDEVSYRIRARSWPQALITRVGQPVVRVLQARFRRDSAVAMRRAVNRSS